MRWTELPRDSEGRWLCPHCDKEFVTGRRNYGFSSGAAGAVGCGAGDPEQRAVGGEEEEDDAWDEVFSGTAAAFYRRQLLEVAADWEQQLVDMGLDDEQQRHLIEVYYDRVLLDAEYLQQVQEDPQHDDDDDDGDEPPAPDAAQVEAIRRQADQYIKLLQRPLFQGCRADNALHADFMLFEWRGPGRAAEVRPSRRAGQVPRPHRGAPGGVGRA
ncbi:MAG: hypothetical protein J3K34DRAFT_422011 [Monoraphidium minutum]|nr:MAG: hypothetical protein J3K34DRAFT_422011 [Monoraphidium minutum]